MDLKALRTFMMVAETGSLSKASDRLRLAQPALSRHIKLLEDEIQITLFERSPRGMRLTGAGKEFFGRIAGLIRQIDQSVVDVRSIASKISGHVSLGIMGSVSSFLAGRLIRRVASDLPDVSLRIVHGSSYRLVEWLQNGEVDITLLYGPETNFHFRTRRLFSEELLLMGPVDSKFDPAVPVPFAELEKLDLVLTNPSRGIRTIVENAASRRKISLRTRYEVDSFPILKDLVANGLGYTILPRSALSPSDGPSLKAFNLVRPKLTRQIILALPSDRGDTRATSAIVSHVVDEVNKLIESEKLEATLLTR